MTKFDLNTFLRELNKDLSQLTLKHNIHVNDQFEKFRSIFHKIADKHAPLRKALPKEKRLHAKPWLTLGLLKSIQKYISIYYTKITMKICSKITKIIAILLIEQSK